MNKLFYIFAHATKSQQNRKKQKKKGNNSKQMKWLSKFQNLTFRRIENREEENEFKEMKRQKACEL